MSYTDSKIVFVFFWTDILAVPAMYSGLRCSHCSDPRENKRNTINQEKES